MEIFLGADHNGFKLKESIKKYLKNLGVNFRDLGNTVFDLRDDYPYFALKVGKQVVKTKSKGILICGSGQGVCLAANKIKGIRAALVFNKKQSQKVREELNSNILCLAGQEISFQKAKEIVKTWLKTKFSRRKRYLRRLKEIQQIEKIAPSTNRN